jgi:hypothetical protein
MSRSYKKTPITGNAGESDKNYKRIRAGRERMRQRNRLHDYQAGLELAELWLRDELSPWDAWASDKDGKRYFDARKYPYLMRK